MTVGMWLISIACAIMTGMGKTGVQGMGNLVVPLMAMVFGAMPSSGIVLPMLVMADIFGVAYYHKSAEWKTLLKVLPWAAAGIGLGLITGKQISASQFRHLMAILVIISLIVMVWMELRKIRDGNGVPHKPWFAIPFGITGGFSTMIGNAAGPVMSIFLLSAGLNKNTFIGTAAWFFLIVNVSKMPLQIWGWNNITIETLKFTLLLLPAIALGAFAGIKIVKLIPESGYRWFIVIATFISAMALFF